MNEKKESGQNWDYAQAANALDHLAGGRDRASSQGPSGGQMARARYSAQASYDNFGALQRPEAKAE